MWSQLAGDQVDAQAWAQRLNDELQRYVPELVAAYAPERIILFGSAAQGQARNWSDLDLVVVCETGLRFLDRTKDVLRRLRPKVGLDVLVYTPEEFDRLCRLRPFFQREVLSQGQVLYERPC